MSDLPPSPNLEHLKRQAKRLLREWRSGSPEARRRVEAQIPGSSDTPDSVDRTRRLRLADAQRVVAREYGFASWAKLKAYVEAVAANEARAYPEPSVRRRFLRGLAGELVASARRGDAEALGARFATMPLRDILAVRDLLVSTGRVRVVVDGLLEGLDDARPRVRFDCAGALDHMADERCAVPLRRLLEDPVPRVRRAALHSLSCDACKLGPLVRNEDLVPVLIGMALNDPSVRVRRSAVPMLEGYCHDGRAVATMRRLATRDADTKVLRTAREALRRRGVTVAEP